MSELEFASPVTVDPLAAPGGALTLADAGATTKVLVRAGSETAAATRLSVPFGQSREFDDRTLVCGTRPDEWTLYAAPGVAPEVIKSIPEQGFVTVIDITHGRAMIRISGPCSTLALAKVCNIDFADDMVPDGAVFSAAVAGVSCDLVRNDQAEGRSYLLTCERSFGRYLFVALADAGTEFGLNPPEGWTLH
ncbi:MAG: hypothetical protein VX833_08090 [Actinomycetota bacterium]|nr:hypothetical protein [Actinomycetota bacterium]